MFDQREELAMALFYVGRRHDMLVRNIKAACRPITVDGKAFNVAAAEGEAPRG
jgi:hypothetical protein